MSANSKNGKAGIWQVAVPAPLARLFDYRPPAEAQNPVPGIRVRVPFGRSYRIGILLDTAPQAQISPARLKSVQAILDSTPILPADMLALARWVAGYYHHPLGEVLAAMLPAALRQGRSAQLPQRRCLRLTAAGRAQSPDRLVRAPRQAQILGLLQTHPEGLDSATLRTYLKVWQAPVRSLISKGWVETIEAPALPPSMPAEPEAVDLNRAQEAAVAWVIQHLTGFHPALLEGVTGSGKTEVYLQIIAEVVARGHQALVLVPEIALTPQLVERFRRLPGPLVVLHSGLSDRERLHAWLLARDGYAPVVIGTRSAVFTPLARPGVLILDEEHDGSFKQQEGLRYHGRDVAVWRARQAGVPVLLGSATPSLESLANVTRGRYQHLHLPERAGAASPPSLQLLDVRGGPLEDNLSPVMIRRIKHHLEAGQQVLLFLNRRGYAPIVLCHDCGWVADCQRCDARLVLHQRQGCLRCHHCGAESTITRYCPDCGSIDLRPLGQGTEGLEQALAARLPETPITRIDRDSTQAKGRLEALLQQAQAGHSQVLIGTQMLAKGHHLPNVTLVGILDADRGLFGVDFRAAERMAQLIIQVAGRAGRADKPGEVLIQTHHPDHPLLRTLTQSGYAAFAEQALIERQQVGLPPYHCLALLRAESPRREAPMVFLEAAYQYAELPPGVELWGPVPAPMERRAGRYRYQLLVNSATRSALHQFLGPWLAALGELRAARRVRWSIDVDPGDML